MSSNSSSTRFSTRNKVGFVLAALLGVSDVVSMFPSGGSDAEPGPPKSILVIDGVLGIVTVVAVIVAWRTLSRGAVRLAAGTRIVSMVSALPAFFVDVPAWVKVAVAVLVVLTFVAVTLMLAPARDDARTGEPVAG